MRSENEESRGFQTFQIRATYLQCYWHGRPQNTENTPGCIKAGYYEVCHTKMFEIVLVITDIS